MPSIVPLLAFGFAAPWMLWGALLALAPILIHLLFRRQYRETPWAAMQFLLAAAQRQSRWSRIDQWLLLAVRTLIPLAAAIALAGPLLDLATGGSSSIPTQRVLALDVGLSTQAREDGRSRWSRVREAATELTAQAQPGDTWQLVSLGSSPPQAVIAEPTFLVEPVQEELRQLDATAASGSAIEALQLVGELLSHAEAGMRREVYLFTDGQRSTWKPEVTTERERLKELLDELSQQARVVWVDVSEKLVGNTAITDLSLTEPFVLAGQPLRAVATIRQFGQVAGPATLQWRVDGRLVASQSLDPTEGPELRRELRYTPSAAGELRIEASLDADALTPDDRRGAVCVVREVVRVLLVDGRPSGIPFQNATDCLRLALAPEVINGGQGRVEPTVLSDGRLLSANLDEFDVVFLCDVPLITDREAELLADYVAAGGGLVIAAGPNLRAEAYNQTLLASARPLLPARLGDIMGDAQRREQTFGFMGGEFQHPILQPFRGNPNTGFELTQTFAYRKSFPVERARVAVAFDNGDPAIIESTFGRGRVLLVTTSLDRTWGTWAVWGHTFVPMMHETVRYLLSSQLQNRNVLVGAPLVHQLRRATANGVVQVRDPADQRTAVSPVDNDGAWLVAFDDTRQPGFYAVEPAGVAAPPIWFSVNTDPRESDLTPLAATELRDGLFGGRPIDAGVGDDGTPIAGVRPSVAQENTLPRWLLGAVLILLIGEPFLAWNRGLGLGIAAGLVAIAAAGAWGGAWGAVIAALVGASAVGVALFRHRLVPRSDLAS